ncbi:MAG: hypothetical protein ACI4J1_00335 [Ruminiclostridium sp.]
MNDAIGRKGGSAANTAETTMGELLLSLLFYHNHITDFRCISMVNIGYYF